MAADAPSIRQTCNPSGSAACGRPGCRGEAPELEGFAPEFQEGIRACGLGLESRLLGFDEHGKRDRSLAVLALCKVGRCKHSCERLLRETLKDRLEGGDRLEAALNRFGEGTTGIFLKNCLGGQTVFGSKQKRRVGG